MVEHWPMLKSSGNNPQHHQKQVTSISKLHFYKIGFGIRLVVWGLIFNKLSYTVQCDTHTRIENMIFNSLCIQVHITFDKTPCEEPGFVLETEIEATWSHLMYLLIDMQFLI